MDEGEKYDTAKLRSIDWSRIVDVFFFPRSLIASLAAVLQLIIINHKSKMENDVFYFG